MQRKRADSIPTSLFFAKEGVECVWGKAHSFAVFSILSTQLSEVGLVIGQDVAV